MFFETQHTIMYVTHINLTGINIMAKLFANVCFWDVFVICVKKRNICEQKYYIKILNLNLRGAFIFYVWQ